MTPPSNASAIFGVLLFAAVLAVPVVFGIKTLRAPAGQQPTSARIGAMFSIGFGGAFLLMLLSVWVHAAWLSGAALVLLLGSFALWPISALQREREINTARIMDAALGLPVARKLLHPGLVAALWVLAGIGTATAVGVTVYVVTGQQVEARTLTTQAAETTRVVALIWLFTIQGVAASVG